MGAGDNLVALLVEIGEIEVAMAVNKLWLWSCGLSQYGAKALFGFFTGPYQAPERQGSRLTAPP